MLHPQAGYPKNVAPLHVVTVEVQKETWKCKQDYNCGTQYYAMIGRSWPVLYPYQEGYV